MRVLTRELLYLGISEGDWELDRVRCMEIDWPHVRGCFSSHAADYFLAFVAIVNVRCKHLFICVFAVRDI